MTERIKRGLITTGLLAVVSAAAYAQTSVTTQHNDIARTGANTNETILTPSNVNANTFGKLFSAPVDGRVYAQPLYMPGVTMGTGTAQPNTTHNVVFVATEHDSVIAFDADSNTRANANPLWQVSLIDAAHGAGPGETTVLPSGLSLYDVLPEIGITSTPVIDPASNTIYVVAKSTVAGTTFIQRLHALDITTGQEKFGGPVQLSGSVPGNGTGSWGGTLNWDPMWENNRAGLLLLNGIVYIGFGSHQHNGPSHGWILAYSASTLDQTGVWCASPNAAGAGIWMSGTGLAADVPSGKPYGRIFTATGNGTFDAVAPNYTNAMDYGDSIIKLDLANGAPTMASGGTAVGDAFTPLNQAFLNANDWDQASGGVVILPDSVGGVGDRLVQVGKSGIIYVLNRENLGGYHPNNTTDPGASAQVDGLWGAPAYWNGTVYVWTTNLVGTGSTETVGTSNNLMAFGFANGAFTSSSPGSTSAEYAGWPSPTPSISANGTTNGIVWSIRTDNYPHGQAILYAHDAANVATLLYSSESNVARDNAGNAIEFVVPTVANGKVYVGTESQLSVYGLLEGGTQAATPTFNPPSVASGTGLISGTPTAAGTSRLPHRAPNAGGTGKATLTRTPAAAAVAPFVQTVANAVSNSASSFSLSFPANTAAGDLILVAFDYSANTTPSSVTDTQGNVFAPIGKQLTSPGGASSRVYYAANIKGGADKVTVSLSASSAYIELYLTEYAGIAQTNPIDAQAGVSGGAGAVSSGNATTTVAGDIIYGYCVGDGNCKADSGFTTRSNFNANLIEDMTAGNPGTYAATGTANHGWTMQMVALKPSSPVITSATTASGTVGTAFSYQITATNTPTSYAATGLPAGLSVNSTTGLISGTPTAAGTSTVTLSATNGSGTGNATLTLTIAAAPAAPAITSATTASGTVGTAFSYQITATNTPTSYGATGLPAGLSVNSTTGVISGTPTTAGTSTVTLSATNADGTGKATLTLTIAPAAPAITSATTASGIVGIPFLYQITATNTPTSYGATGLPAGLSVNSTTGLISGTPTAAGTSTVTLSATNGGGTGKATLTVTLATGVASFIQAVANAVSSSASTFSLSLPANTVAGDVILVAFDYDTNATPSSVTDTQGNVFAPIGNQLTSPGGSRSRVYYAANIKGGADTVTVSLSASSAYIELYLTEYSGIAQTNPIDAQAGASGSAGAVSSGNATTTVAGDVIYGYCVGDGNCTAGSGFTTHSNFSGNLIEAMQAGNPGSYAATGTANHGWTMQMVALKPSSVAAGVPAITSATTASGTVGTAFSYQITATNTPTSYAATGLPAGLSVSSTTGLISGTPTAAGTSTVTLSATNGSGTGNATLTLTIGAANEGVSGGWTYLQNAISWSYVNSNNQCTITASTCTFSLAPLTAGSVVIINAITSDDVTITSAKVGSQSATLCGSNGCHVVNAGYDSQDSAYLFTSSGNAGATTATINLSGAAAPSSGFFYAQIAELLPPTCGSSPCTPAFDTFTAFPASGSNICESCTFPTVSPSATDGVFGMVDSANGFTGSNAASASYGLNIVGNMLALNLSSPGTALTGTQWNGSQFLTVGLMAFKSSAGTFTATPSNIWSIINPAAAYQVMPPASLARVSCTPACPALTIPSTGSGHLLFMHVYGLASGYGHLSSVSGGGSWVIPTGAKTCQITWSFGAISCGWVLSSASGVTTVTPTMSTSGIYDVAIYEVSKSSGSITLDAQGVTYNGSASRTPSGQALTLTNGASADDACFQQIFADGSPTGAGAGNVTLYTAPWGQDLIEWSQNTPNGVATAALLNTNNGAAPIWQITPTATASIVSGVCFK